MNINETTLIASLKKAFPPSILPAHTLGIGDDAAVLPPLNPEQWVITQDLLAENKHFRRRYFSPEDLAHKALQVNLSDLAAMGAKPVFALLSLAIPGHYESSWISAFTSSFSRACHQAQINLLGGDTTAAEHDLFIQVTAIGRALPHHLKYRQGAQTGDQLCLIGTLGHAHAGLQALEHGVEGLELIKAATLRPSAHIQEGLWLAQQPGVTALMDLSDGLYVDLERLLKASSKGAQLPLENLPLSPELETACQSLGLDPLECLLVGGEEYALLCTIQAQAYPLLAQTFKTQFQTPFTRLGSITTDPSLVLLQNHRAIPLPYPVFSHF